MQILRAANYKVMPWKNGLGSTTEIAISPADAKLDDFDWRVSMAQVTSDGAFSSFPGIDRSLLVLEGDGIVLDVADRESVRIDRNSIHSFPGDQPTSATLINGPIVDLNIMSRRGRVQHRVQRTNVISPLLFTAATPTLLFVEHGALTVRSLAGLGTLDEHDALLIGPHLSSVTVETAGTACVIAIAFR
jgi:environmental stress-induced protein Ves